MQGMTLVIRRKLEERLGLKPLLRFTRGRMQQPNLFSEKKEAADEPLPLRQRAIEWLQQGWRPPAPLFAVALALALCLERDQRPSRPLHLVSAAQPGKAAQARDPGSAAGERPPAPACRSPQERPRRHRARGSRKTPLRQARRSHLHLAPGSPQPVAIPAPHHWSLAILTVRIVNAE